MLEGLRIISDMFARPQVAVDFLTDTNVIDRDARCELATPAV